MTRVTTANLAVSAGATLVTPPRNWSELGAAFLCADLDITAEPRDDHASYLAPWFDVLKSDKRAIFTAAAHAQRAADYLHGLQRRHEAAGATG